MSEAQRILVVDAKPETRGLFDAALGSLGCEIVYRDKSVQAVVAEERFEVAVLDLGSEWARVPEVLRTLRANPGTAATSFVVIADSSRAEEIALALDAGIDDFLLTPLNAADLRGRMMMHLHARHSAARTARRQHALSAMIDITQALVSSLDIQEILFTVVRRIANLVRVARVSIVLVPDDGGNAGYVVAASDDVAVSNLRLDLQKYPEIRHVLCSKQPLTIGDVDTHPVLDGVRGTLPTGGLSSLTLIPMVFEGNVLGVLFIRAQTRKGALDEQQVGLCQVLANATAIALRNARILTTLRAETQRDTSARVEAENRLAALKRYADVFESAADGIAALDNDACLLYANPAAYTLLGYEASELRLGFPVYDLISVEDRRKLLALRMRFAEGEYPRNVDLRIKRKDGAMVIISCTFSPLHGEEATVLLSFRDVTDARQTQEELVQTRNFLQSLIDASVDAIVAADMRGTIILFNEGAQRLYGHRAEDALNKMSAKELYPRDGAREVGRMLRSKGHGGVGRLEPVRIEAIDKHGNIFPISLTAATIYQKGKAVATFGIFSDLRDRVRVEEQLAQAQEKLALSEKQSLVAELAGATAHELNQPLTSVMGYAELLMRKVGEQSPAHHAAKVILSEAQRMAEIVRKIGKLTRYETKSYVGEQRILDLDRGSQDDTEPKS